MIKYLLDENANGALHTAMRRHGEGRGIYAVGDPCAPPRQTPDAEILRWCEAHDFIQLTNNRASMPVHLREYVEAGGHVPGIFTLNPAMSIEETVRELELIRHATFPGEFADEIRHLPISYDRPNTRARAGRRR